MATFGQTFGLGLPILARMALQFDIQPIREHPGQPIHQSLSRRALPLLQQAANRPIRPAGQADQPVRMLRQFLQRDLRQLPALVHIKAGTQLHQVLIPRLGLRQQHQRRGWFGFFTRLHLYIGQIDLTAHDRLHPGPAGGDRELQGREHRIGVCHRNGGHVHLRAKPGQLFQPHSAFQQGIFSVNAKVNESRGTAHTPYAIPAGRPTKAGTARPTPTPDYSAFPEGASGTDALRSQKLL